MYKFQLTALLSLLTTVFLVLCSAPALGQTEDWSSLDRGHRLLLENGELPLHALVFLPPGTANLQQIKDANYTGIHFGSANWETVMTHEAVGDMEWSRWSANPPSSELGLYDPTGMLMASSVDEQSLFNPDVVTGHATWLQGMRNALPNVISHITDAVISGNIATIQNYMSIAQPDMLFWDYYTFGGDNSSPNPWPGGSPTGFYNMMGKYRAAGRAGNNGDYTKPIPAGLWVQTYKFTGYSVSESELAVQYGAAWAYGHKALSTFTYATTPIEETASGGVPSALFDGPNDTNPTPLYYRIKELNRQTQNIAPALLRLKSESVLFVRGQHSELTENVTNDLPDHASDWSSTDDPYMTNITVTNVSHPLGTIKNDGLPGDVIMGYFKPLNESFDGPDYVEQLYFMVVNGLSDTNGNILDTRQQIRLDFDFGISGITSLQRIDRDTGDIVVTDLISDGGSLYHLDWFLGGGEGELFKYNTGAIFVSELAIPEPTTAALLTIGGLALLRRKHR